MMPFCYAPWANLDINPQGDIAPCCKYQFSKGESKFNTQHHSLSEYANSDFLNSIKEKLALNQWPEGCNRCRIDEQNNIASMRQLNQQRWQDHYSGHWITASIAFGNTCNLKCLPCGSHSSSKWQKEYKKIYGIDFKPVKFYKENFVSSFIQSAPGLIHLDIPGGEPFISGVDEQKNLLRRYIQTQQSKEITLHYTTNATIWPEREWWELWSCFKQVEIQLSIDGVGNKNEYLRYPSNWQQVENNVRKYVRCGMPTLQLSVSHTVSAYNIYYLDEFFRWCRTIGLPKPWLGRVHRPEHMRCTVWPDPGFIIKHLSVSEFDDVKNWISLLQTQNDSDQFFTFVQRTKQHDDYRKTQFESVFPELVAHL
jgi:MoaA/NifB/PqqE/SkfB family radical SAM enzyme